MHNSYNWATLSNQPDRDPNRWVPMQKVRGTVKWVNEPMHIVSALPSLFLAVYRYPWGKLLEDSAHHAFTLHIGVGYPVTRRLLAHIYWRLKRRKYQLSTSERSGCCSTKQSIKIKNAHAVAFLKLSNKP
jgi:hypothetical protein